MKKGDVLINDYSKKERTIVEIVYMGPTKISDVFVLDDGDRWNRHLLHQNWHKKTV